MQVAKLIKRRLACNVTVIISAQNSIIVGFITKVLEYKASLMPEGNNYRMVLVW